MVNDDIVIRFFNDDKTPVLLSPNAFEFISISLLDCLREASKYADLSDDLRELLEYPVEIRISAVEKGSIIVAFRAILNFPNSHKEQIENYTKFANLLVRIYPVLAVIAIHYGFLKVEFLSEDMGKMITHVTEKPGFNRDQKLPMTFEGLSVTVLGAGAQRAVLLLPDQPDFEFVSEANHPKFLGISGSQIPQMYLGTSVTGEILITGEAGEFEVGGKKVVLYFGNLKLHENPSVPLQIKNFLVLVKWESRFQAPGNEDGFVTVTGYLNNIIVPEHIFYSGKMTRDHRNVSALMTVTSRRVDG